MTENTPEKYKTGLFGVGKEKKAIKSALLLIKALTVNDIPPINIDLIRVGCSGPKYCCQQCKKDGCMLSNGMLRECDHWYCTWNTSYSTTLKFQPLVAPEKLA